MIRDIIQWSAVLALVTTPLRANTIQEYMATYRGRAEKILQEQGRDELLKVTKAALAKMRKTKAISLQDRRVLVKRAIPTSSLCTLALQQYTYLPLDEDRTRDIEGHLPTTTKDTTIILLAELKPEALTLQLDDDTQLPSVCIQHRQGEVTFRMIQRDHRRQRRDQRRLIRSHAYCAVLQQQEKRSPNPSVGQQQAPAGVLPAVPLNLQSLGQAPVRRHYGSPSTLVANLMDGQDALAARYDLMDRATGPGTLEWLQTHIYMADPAGMTISHKLAMKRATGADVAVMIDSQSVFWDFRDLFYNANTAIMFHNLMAWGVRVRGFNCFDANLLNRLKWRIAKAPSNASQYWEELIRSFRRNSKDPIYGRVHQKVHLVANDLSDRGDEFQDAYLALMANAKTFDAAYTRAWCAEDDGKDFFDDRHGLKKMVRKKPKLKMPSCFNPFDPIKQRSKYLGFAIENTLPYFKRKPKGRIQEALALHANQLEVELAERGLLPHFYQTKDYSAGALVKRDKSGAITKIHWPVRMRSAQSLGTARNVLAGVLGKTAEEHFSGLGEAYRTIIEVDKGRRQAASVQVGSDELVRHMIIGGRNIGADYFELEGRELSQQSLLRTERMAELRQLFPKTQRLAHEERVSSDELAAQRKEYQELLAAHRRHVVKRWRDMEAYVMCETAGLNGTAFGDTSYRSRFRPVREALFIQNRPDKNKSHNVIKEYVISLIDRARKRVRILSSYYNPDVPTVAALERARKRGVDVEIITNDGSVNDLPPVSTLTDYWAVEHFAYVPKSSEARIKLFYFDGKGADGVPVYGTNHSKVLVVDDDVAAIMSWNMDGRSMGHEGFGADFPSVNQEDALFFTVAPKSAGALLISELHDQLDTDRAMSRPIGLGELIESHDIHPRVLVGRVQLWQEKRAGMHPNRSWDELKTFRRNLMLGLHFPGPSFF